MPPETDPAAEAAVEAVIARALGLASEVFTTGAGPGGQNVNKVATAVQLRLDVYALRLPPPVFHRLKELAGSRMTARGELLIAARRFRTQEQNRADARDRLADLLRDAHRLPEKRAKSRLNRVGKTQRLEGKKRRGAVKAGRGRVSFD
jgi:ribosome-associated protein